MASAPLVVLLLLAFSLLSTRALALPAGWPQSVDRSGEEQTEDAREARALLRSRYALAVTSQTDFGLDMYQQLVADDNSTTRFYSPISVATALAMLYGGTRGNTAAQIETVLHYGDQPQAPHRQARLLGHIQNRPLGGVTVKSSNNLYISKNDELQPDYSSYIQDVFGADVTSVDFSYSQQAADFINQRVLNDTDGNIKELVPADKLDDMTHFVIVNAIYFKGDWAGSFKESETQILPFHGLERKTLVPTMHKLGNHHLYYPRRGEIQASFLILPYVGNEVVMMLVVPHKRDGIFEVESQLNSEVLGTYMTNAMERGQRQVSVFLPKFRLETEIDLKPVLIKMGMPDAFDSLKADLSGISSQRGSYISYAVHKAFVDVNEEGTEAAAATGIIGVWRSVPLSVRADHSFIFAIMDVTTQAVLFMGRVTDIEPPPEHPLES